MSGQSTRERAELVRFQTHFARRTGSRLTSDDFLDRVPTHSVCWPLLWRAALAFVAAVAIILFLGVEL